MAFEDIKSEIYSLLDQMTNQPEDMHELAEAVRERIAELRATGMPVPEDLQELEKKLDARYGGKPKKS